MLAYGDSSTLFRGAERGAGYGATVTPWLSLFRPPTMCSIAYCIWNMRLSRSGVIAPAHHFALDSTACRRRRSECTHRLLIAMVLRPNEGLAESGGTTVSVYEHSPNTTFTQTLHEAKLR